MIASSVKPRSGMQADWIVVLNDALNARMCYEVISMNTWLEDIILAFENCGGISDYSNLYDEVSRIRKGKLPSSWKAIVRGTIENHSSDSDKFRGKGDLFFSVEGIGNGVWGLRKSNVSSLYAKDLEEPPQTIRSKLSVYRVLRDTSLARCLKSMYDNKCQICGESIEVGNKNYSEAHHIQPLGIPHNGPDVAGNIIVLCPNHHVQCDYGAIRLNLNEIRQHESHSIEKKYVDYHNRIIVE